MRLAHTPSTSRAFSTPRSCGVPLRRCRRRRHAEGGVAQSRLSLAAFLADKIPDWIPARLGEPGWWRPLTHFVRVFVFEHQTGGLFFVIFLEELGVPLPAPGDAAIAYGGYLTATGAIP